MVPAVTERVILNDELCCDRRTVAQRDRGRLIQLVITERSHRVCGLSAVLAQKFQRGGLCYPSMLLGMLGIQFGHRIPTDIGYGIAAGDCSRDLNLDRVHAGYVMHYQTNRTAVSRRHRRIPLRLGQFRHEGSQDVSAQFDPVG
jgi:hypothetical protein